MKKRSQKIEQYEESTIGRNLVILNRTVQGHILKFDNDSEFYPPNSFHFFSFKLLIVDKVVILS